ncbi:MAG: hypothetical protein LC750_18095, partial [Actinobacteria bacterium]|nr:hypothetical protein [Actinomycetota bacterium]
VKVVAGKSARTEDGLGRAVQLHRMGSSYGAFAYINPRASMIILRLQEIDLDQHPHATLRNVRAGDKYKIKVRFADEKDLPAITAVVRLAYDAAGS